MKAKSTKPPTKAKGYEALSPLSSAISPESFHLSLSSLMLGHDPVIPAMLPSPESNSVEPATSEEATDPSSEESKHGGNSEKVSTSEAAEQSSDPEHPCRKPCKTHRYQNDKCLEGHADLATSISAAESSGRSSSEAAETTDNDDSGWTMSEDAKLRGMKEDDRGPTWVEISQVIGRSKKECQLRWKDLKDQLKKSDADHESEDKGQGKAAKKHKQHGKQRQPRKHKKGGKQQKNKSPPRPSSIRSGEVPSSPPSSSDSDPNDMTFTGSPGRRRQKRYMHTHVHSALYGRSIPPEPDDYFSQRDCDVLGSMNSKYKQGKYLEMQANFFNVTGRMIPLSVIKDKCERTEEDEKRGRAKFRESNERKRVERWVSSVDEDDLEDPGS